MNGMKLFYFSQKSERSLYFNLAMEEAICLQLNSNLFAGGLRFWSNRNSIVLGLSDPIEKNIPESLLETFRNQFPSVRDNPHLSYPFPLIGRRASGGGTVYQETNWNLNFSIFVNLTYKKELFPISHSYEVLSSIALHALNDSGITAFKAGKSDLSIKGKNGELLKISGNSQFRKRDCLVHHGTLILKQELIDSVKSLLKHPPQEPDYRKGRTHEQFITHLPSEFSTLKFENSLKLYFQEYMGGDYYKIPSGFRRKIRQSLRELETEKYLNSEFIFSR